LNEKKNKKRRRNKIVRKKKKSQKSGTPSLKNTTKKWGRNKVNKKMDEFIHP
jgi:hypothetical protein